MRSLRVVPVGRGEADAGGNHAGIGFLKLDEYIRLQVIVSQSSGASLALYRVWRASRDSAHHDSRNNGPCHCVARGYR